MVVEKQKSARTTSSVKFFLADDDVCVISKSCVSRRL